MQYYINKCACCFLHSRREKEDAAYDGDDEQGQDDDVANERTRWQGTGKTVEQMHSTTYLGRSPGTQDETAGGRCGWFGVVVSL